MQTKAIVPFIIFLTCVAITSFGQQSMVPDISYTYLQKLIDTAKKYYPKMQAYQHSVKSAEASVSKAKVSWFDVLNFTYLYSPNNTTTVINNPSLLNGYQFGVYFNLGSLLEKKPEINIAKENLAIAKLDQKEYELNIEALVKERYFTYIGELSVLKLRTQSVSDAQAAMNDLKYKYEKGEETFDNYSKALINYSDVTQAKIETESAMFVAKSSLEELLGKKLEEIN